MQLYNVIDQNTNAKFTTYLDDLKYLHDLEINNSTIESKKDIQSLIELVNTMDDIHINHMNKYEAWKASEFDDHYGWEFIPSTHVKRHIIDALDKYKTLYVKVIEDRIINLYSEDCTDKSKLVTSFSVTSD